ncbi:ABC transporter ATP-binding protein [Caloranaerobacter azorensis]|uniref:ABC transporter ATP-binding protein n=1 Tax=Caloranaerobacter azorensis TaxID=116090 RepID=A0A6P1YAS0_9FIRM|nr:ABC transporter ATP-binding protein [Caloranaerobacter azorensis]QIB26450.1 ABC transporter ATP-binding protein [Caloranaerobacter azorensis]
MQMAIEVESLYFSYGDSLILRDINFKIKKGEFVSIIGPNGSGKSTLLKNMISIYKPNRGSIKIDGKEIREYKAKELAKKVAIVPQDTNIAYDFSVFDVVIMGRNPYLGRFQSESYKDFQIVEDSLKLTDTLHLKDKSINQISGGERQRVIIARALAQEPEIMLLDEPTSHLDINHQIEILSLLKKLNTEKSMTIIIVIHDINLAARYSSKMILLNKGEIISIGKPREVITYENIEMAYNLNVVITENLYTNSPYLIPLTSKKL